MPGSRALALTPDQTADPPAATDAQVSAPQAAAAQSAARGGLGRRLLRSKALPRLISPVILLAAWQAVSSAGLVSAAKLPPPTEVWSTAVSLATTTSAAYGSLGENMLVSLERVATGFAFGAIVALVVAITAGLSRLGENAVDPLMQMLRTLPLFGLIPVFIVWFGIGELPKILLIAIGVAIPLYLNTFAGIRNVDAKLAELGQVLHLSRRELVTQIVLPGALPQMLVLSLIHI